jgi:hypothetical protein
MIRQRHGVVANMVGFCYFMPRQHSWQMGRPVAVSKPVHFNIVFA